MREIDINEVSVGEILGTGASSSVYECTWRRDVYVIKVLQQDHHPDHEISILRHLEEMNVPSCIRYIGRSLYQGRECIILERGGETITDWLEKKSSIGDRKKVALSLLEGYRSLVTMSDIDHGDLHSKNILVDDNLNIKIIDFDRGSKSLYMYDIYYVCEMISSLMKMPIPDLSYMEREDLPSYIDSLYDRVLSYNNDISLEASSRLNGTICIDQPYDIITSDHVVIVSAMKHWSIALVNAYRCAKTSGKKPCIYLFNSRCEYTRDLISSSTTDLDVLVHFHEEL